MVGRHLVIRNSPLRRVEMVIDATRMNSNFENHGSVTRRIVFFLVFVVL